MSKLELILLGQFECLLPSGTRISLSMRKAEVLLAYLALTPGLRHPRERLINLLWSDRGEEQARNSLRQCLSAIRKSLGDVADMVLQVDRTTVSLVPELIYIDVHEFERLAAEGNYESLNTAAGLYQGEFLEGISIRDASCQEWLDGERSRFKRQFIEILSELAETQLLSHDFSNAIKSAERLVKQDPLGESGWRQLMRSYHESDDRNHALQAFKRCQHALREELDVEPESATIELRDRIAGGEKLSEAIPGAAATPSAPAEKPAPNSPTSTDHSVAVLPFDNLSGDPEQEYFSDGITDSIILNLSLFPGLNIKSRNSSFAFKQQIKSIGEISSELGVDYVIEGSIRRSRDRVRITVQLIEASNGNQVWGKRYDAEIDDLLDLEEELSRTIATTITGQIESDLQRIAIAKGAAHQQSYDLLLQGIYHCKKSTASDMTIAIEKLNQCLAMDSSNALAHATLYACHEMNWIDRWVIDFEASRKLCKVHASKALALNPDLGPVQVAFAEYLIFNRDYDEAETHLNRALEINPNDSDAIAALALNLSAQGKFEAALKQARLVLQLDPYHNWARWILADSQFFCGLYEEVLGTIADTGNAPGFIQLYKTAANVRLGRMEVANNTLKSFLQHCSESMSSMPRTIEEWLAYSRDNAPFADPAFNQEIIDDLLQAGLEEEMAAAQNSTDPEALPSIAVLPFENMSGDPEQEHFADGITTDIIATLSKFRHMRVVARYSILQYKDQKTSISDIAEQQKVRYILEGSVRKSGGHIRVSAELIDSKTDQVCWSERFDRNLDDLFAVQDEITQSIALAMKVQMDDGEMALHRSKGATSIKAWELTMAAVDLAETYIRQNILDARAITREAIQLDPDYAYAWINLGWTYWQEAYSGWSDSIEELIDEAVKANQHAMSLDPNYGEVWSQAGMNHQMKHEADEAIAACRSSSNPAVPKCMH
jgi:TolB-like protein/DNA-binding SARP family transcriptional activator